MRLSHKVDSSVLERASGLAVVTKSKFAGFGKHLLVDNDLVQDVVDILKSDEVGRSNGDSGQESDSSESEKEGHPDEAKSVHGRGGQVEVQVLLGDN